jgi:phenylacetate-CoA ligase
MNNFKLTYPEILAGRVPITPRDLQYEPAKEIKKIQNSLLADHIEYVAKNSPYYKSVFHSSGLNHKDIQDMSSLKKIPPTTKDDLIEKNQQFLAVNPDEIVDVCLTSGTTGDTPAMLLQTQSDLARLALNEEIAFHLAGLTEKDTLLICAALDRAFMAGLAYFLGGLRIKARMVRSGAGSASQHWHLIKITHATALVGVPSLMLRIAEYGTSLGEDPSETEVKKLIAIGESVRDRNFNLLPLAQKNEEIWDAQIYSTYASTELATTFCECDVRRGGHLRPELIVLEIVDENNNPLSDGQEGEIVVTPLGVKGMPLVRFKTGDVSFVIPEPCKCGRKTSRLGPILGRKNQMLKYKGTTIFPNAIISALEGQDYFEGGYVEARRNVDGTDRVILHLASTNPQMIEPLVENELRGKIRVVPEIVFHSKEEINCMVFQPEKKRKRITFVDSRN